MKEEKKSNDKRVQRSPLSATNSDVLSSASQIKKKKCTEPKGAKYATI